MPLRGLCVSALLATFLVCGTARAQVPIPDLRTQLVGPASDEPLPSESIAYQPVPNIAPPYSTPRTDVRETGVLTGWDDGFYVRSADKRFSLRVTGQLQA